ncbi:hypothetical protein GCM10007304_39600 [Rhodococcoides trifolii]|uniref:Uncharacterized protein n=1 Tax=Rhodococcoides trifolii TaxID=908250 RepID=A0A917LGR4_9NOCA|nr:hypothetical protein GCM10007304_39600 [Rhodococcus trifolii]
MAETEGVQTGAQDHDLPHARVVSGCDAVFGKSSAGGEEQPPRSVAGKHRLLYTTDEAFDERIVENCGAIEDLVIGARTGGRQGRLAGNSFFHAIEATHPGSTPG